AGQGQFRKVARRPHVSAPTPRTRGGGAKVGARLDAPQWTSVDTSIEESCGQRQCGPSFPRCRVQNPVHTRGVTGSIPVSTTTVLAGTRRNLAVLGHWRVSCSFLRVVGPVVPIE